MLKMNNHLAAAQIANYAKSKFDDAMDELLFTIGSRTCAISMS